MEQRFENFDRALLLLRDALKNGPAALSPLEKAGSVRRFKSSLELSWKTLKDYLEESGAVINPVTSRQVIKDAFAANIIEDGQIWIDLLNCRNLLSHTYDPAVFEKAVDAIAERYLAAIQKLHGFFAARNTQ